MLHPTSLGFPVGATSHIYDTDIKEAQEIEVKCGLLFPHIYPEERISYSILKLMFMHHFTGLDSLQSLKKFSMLEFTVAI